ncbi:MAG TPA: glycoside hydrolase family 130 protein [Limnochordales bacterium]|nr:glycoside hydrolase family 130 protein [Limnochordales bacterium]
MTLRRFAGNPILTPKDVPPSRDDYEVIGVFNAGAVRFRDEIILLLRVAERPRQLDDRRVRVPWLDTTVQPARFGELSWAKDDPEVDVSDPRSVAYRGRHYLTSVSHLRAARSRDGYRFAVDPKPALFPQEAYEAYGLEDPRITPMGDEYWITYVAVSRWGIATALARTRDFVHFERLGILFPPENKNVVLFPGPIHGRHYAFHRPGDASFGPKVIWSASSPDGLSWGQHRVALDVRPGAWDSHRLGAGAPPFRTEQGWLEIYHGVDEAGRYHLGLALFDLDDPQRLIGRSPGPVLSPDAPYEAQGFFPGVVFACGAVAEDDGLVRVYYGAADDAMAVAEATVDELLAMVEPVTVRG